jgi:1-acyl-sn-glycerol-3-phosphate acyltransferase
MVSVALVGAVRLNHLTSSPAQYHAPNRLAVWAFAHYVHRLFARHFASVRWTTLTDPASWDPAIPTLGVANHTNWWDGFLAGLLARALGRQPHVLMDAEQLARYPIFRRVGALPLRRQQARAAYLDLATAGTNLRPDTLLWIFPSGERRPQSERPARFERGAAHLVVSHGGPVRLLPAAFRYVYLGEQLPEAFALLGCPVLLAAGAAFDRPSLTRRLEQETAAAVDALDERLRSESVAGFELLVAGKLSVNKRMDRFRHAVGLLRGHFEARNG